jgi:hypothetical protein
MVDYRLPQAKAVLDALAFAAAFATATAIADAAADGKHPESLRILKVSGT